MIAELHNTFVEEVAKMDTVTDSELNDRGTFVGEIEDPYEVVRGVHARPNSDLRLTDDDQVGYHWLDHCVFNINWLRGTRPYAPEILHMSLEDIESVVYYVNYIVLSTKDSKRFPAGKVITESEYRDNADLIKAESGAKGIYDYMETYGIDPDHKYNMIIFNLPIMPNRFRFIFDDEGKPVKYTSLALDVYEIQEKNDKINKLIDLKTPNIIIDNEKRMLQNLADKYINNGANGTINLNNDSRPTQSLYEVYRMISEYRLNVVNTVPEFTDAEMTVVLKAEGKYIDTLCKEYPFYKYPDMEKDPVDLDKIEEENRLMDEYDKKCDDACSEISEAIKTPVKRWFLKTYGYRYSDYYEFMFDAFTQSFRRIMSDITLKLNAESINEALKVAVENVDFYVDKQLPYQKFPEGYVKDYFWVIPEDDADEVQGNA